MTHRSFIAVALIASVMAGCASFEAATKPTQEQIDAADYGIEPDPAKIPQAIAAWNEDNLKDPASVQLRKMSPPEKGWVTLCVEPGIPPYSYCTKRMFYFGYLVKAEINAKNSYGGYTGYKQWTYLFRGNTVARAVAP